MIRFWRLHSGAKQERIAMKPSFEKTSTPVDASWSMLNRRLPDDIPCGEGACPRPAAQQS
jgi:hypothetical protein